MEILNNYFPDLIDISDKINYYNNLFYELVNKKIRSGKFDKQIYDLMIRDLNLCIFYLIDSFYINSNNNINVFYEEDLDKVKLKYKEYFSEEDFNIMFSNQVNDLNRMKICFTEKNNLFIINLFELNENNEAAYINYNYHDSIKERIEYILISKKDDFIKFIRSKKTN